jgi:hypothetical protein
MKQGGGCVDGWMKGERVTWYWYWYGSGSGSGSGGLGAGLEDESHDM